MKKPGRPASYAAAGVVRAVEPAHGKNQLNTSHLNQPGFPALHEREAREPAAETAQCS